MKTKLFFLILLSVSILSCEKEETVELPHVGVGQWSGTFEGDDMGTWEMDIKSDRTLTGELLSSNVPDITFLGTGNVSADGTVKANIQVSSSTSTMIGKIDGNEMTGTWVNATNLISGTWKGSKK